MRQLHLTNLMIADLCQQLALLLKAGVPTSDGLYLLVQEEQDADYKSLLTGLAEQVENGVYLHTALANSGMFPDYVTGLLHIGEETGRTEETLLSLAAYYEEQDKMNHRLRSALTYPAILLMLMLIVILVLLTKVLPVFEDVYASLGGRLTGIAGVFLTLGGFLHSIMPFLLVLFGLFLTFIAVLSLSSTLRSKLLLLWQRRFGQKGIFRKISAARFAQAMTMTMGSGLPFEEGISMASAMLTNDACGTKRTAACLELLNAGQDLAAALDESGLLPPSSCKLLALGLRAGNGDVTMAEIANRLSTEAAEALERKLSAIEPTLVILTSLLVGVILLSVMLPLMNIMQTIG